MLARGQKVIILRSYIVNLELFLDVLMKGHTSFGCGHVILLDIDLTVY